MPVAYEKSEESGKSVDIEGIDDQEPKQVMVEDVEEQKKPEPKSFLMAAPVV